MVLIDGNTKVFGILGHPTGHSLSPLIHNAAFAARKINAAYVPFNVERSSAALKKAVLTLGIDGLSVTIPHKAWAARSADRTDALTECCGAANTLIRNAKNDTLHAYNTDGPGAVRALKVHLPDLRGRRFLLLGYGGSATAIAHALVLDESPAMLAVAGRNARKLGTFVDAIKNRHRKRSTLVRGTNFNDIEPRDVDVIIHTTPLGMKGAEQDLPLPDNFVQDFHYVFDIVYNPMRTPLLQHAAARGAKTVPGYLMLLYQAVLQFELFTGESAPENLMEKELLAALRKRAE